MAGGCYGPGGVWEGGARVRLQDPGAQGCPQKLHRPLGPRGFSADGTPQLSSPVVWGSSHFLQEWEGARGPAEAVHEAATWPYHGSLLCPMGPPTRLEPLRPVCMDTQAPPRTPLAGGWAALAPCEGHCQPHRRAPPGSQPDVPCSVPVPVPHGFPGCLGHMPVCDLHEFPRCPPAPGAPWGSVRVPGGTCQARGFLWLWALMGTSVDRPALPGALGPPAVPPGEVQLPLSRRGRRPACAPGAGRRPGRSPGQSCTSRPG